MNEKTMMMVRCRAVHWQSWLFVRETIGWLRLVVHCVLWQIATIVHAHPLSLWALISGVYFCIVFLCVIRIMLIMRKEKRLIDDFRKQTILDTTFDEPETEGRFDFWKNARRFLRVGEVACPQGHGVPRLRKRLGHEPVPLRAEALCGKVVEGVLYPDCHLRVLS